MRITRVGRDLCFRILPVLLLGMAGSSALSQSTRDLRDEAFRLYDAGEYPRGASLSSTPF